MCDHRLVTYRSMDLFQFKYSWHTRLHSFQVHNIATQQLCAVRCSTDTHHECGCHLSPHSVSATPVTLSCAVPFMPIPMTHSFRTRNPGPPIPMEFVYLGKVLYFPPPLPIKDKLCLSSLHCKCKSSGPHPDLPRHWRSGAQRPVCQPALGGTLAHTPICK